MFCCCTCHHMARDAKRCIESDVTVQNDCLDLSLIAAFLHFCSLLSFSLSFSLSLSHKYPLMYSAQSQLFFILFCHPLKFSLIISLSLSLSLSFVSLLFKVLLVYPSRRCGMFKCMEIRWLEEECGQPQMNSRLTHWWTMTREAGERERERGGGGWGGNHVRQPIGGMRKAKQLSVHRGEREIGKCHKKQKGQTSKKCTYKEKERSKLAHKYHEGSKKRD